MPFIILFLRIGKKYWGRAYKLEVRRMKLIDKTLLDKVSQQAGANERLRQNYNFHSDLDDVLNRLLNAMEPGTYVRPHRHLSPDKEEICLVLRGRIMNFIFDEDGNVIDKRIIDPLQGVYGLEIEAGVWHSLVVLEPNTVVYEVKRGPFAPLSPENMAPWAPSGEDKEEVKCFIDKLLNTK